MLRSGRYSFGKDLRGQGLAEYIIVIVIVAAVIIVGLRYFGGALFGQFQNATDQVNAVGSTKVGLGSGGGSESTSGGGGGTVSRPAPGEVVESSPPVDETAQVVSSSPSVSASSEEAKDLQSRLAHLRPGVGESDEAVVSEISVDWKTILTILGLIILIGVAIVFKEKRTLKLPAKKGKKGFSLFKKKGEDGQVLVIGLIMCVGLMMASITVANVGMMVAEKIKLQDTVDASAYSAAVAEARYMNLSAYLNRTMIANYDMMAFNTAVWAVLDADDHGFAVMTDAIYKIAEIALESIFFAEVVPEIQEVGDLFAAAHTALHTLNYGANLTLAQDEDVKINEYIEIYNTDILSMYQGLLYAALQSSRYEIQREVAKKMDPDVLMTSTLALGAEAISFDELSRAVDWVIRDTEARTALFNGFNDSFNRMMGKPTKEADNPLLLAAATEASLNRFSAGRTRDGDADLLRSFNIGNIIDLGFIETILHLECEIEDFANVFEDYDCDNQIDFVLGAAMRDGYETANDQSHVPFISRQRMREVNFFGLSFRVTGDGEAADALRSIFRKFIGDVGHTSAERHADVGNTANTTFPNFGLGDIYNLIFDGDYEGIAKETYLYNEKRGCSLIEEIDPTSKFPTVCGINSLNMWAAATMYPASGLFPPLIADDHWDGAWQGIEPVDSHKPVIPNLIDPVQYELKVVAEGKEEGVPRYDWRTDIDNVGFPNYIYPTTGAERRPQGTKGGGNDNFLSGPSIAVVGVKPQARINGLQGLGIGNPYSMTAIARSQVYYVRNPNRPDETPSLFNPHWVARLAPIDSDDTPVLLKEGLPFISSLGLTMRPTH